MAAGAMHGVMLDGLRHDTGDRAGHLRAAVPRSLTPGLTRRLGEFTTGLEDGATGVQERRPAARGGQRWGGA
ncbi:hypothetical protein ACWEN3_21900 [Streptomyces sp. NPDC004561]